MGRKGNERNERACESEFPDGCGKNSVWRTEVRKRSASEKMKRSGQKEKSLLKGLLFSLTLPKISVKRQVLFFIKKK